MQVKGLSQKANRFKGENSELDIFSQSGVRVYVIEIDDWLHVMMEAGEDTTSRDLHAAIPLVIEWRDRLLRWQGPWMQGSDNPFLEELSRLHEEGISYTKLANRINHRVVESLKELLKYLDELNIARPNFKTMLDFYLWQPTANQFSFHHASDLLKIIGMDTKEIEELLNLGLENLRSNKPAFESGYPVSRDKLISTLKTWRKGRKHLILKEKEFEDDQE